MNPATSENTRILFLCSRNSCRSQMAEGFAAARGRPGVSVASAGTEATEVNPLAVKVMAEAGVDVSGQKSKSIADLDAPDFDLVITLCEQAAESCPVLPGNPATVHWNLPDPAAVQGDEKTVLAAFRKSRDEIRRLVDDLFDRGYLDAFVAARCSAKLVLDNVSEGIVAHDLKRRIICFNKAAEAITGYKRAELMNRDCHDVFQDGLCGGKCRFEDGPPRKLDFQKEEVEIPTKTGGRRLVERTIKPMMDSLGRTMGVLLAIRDLTRERTLARRAGEIEQFSGIVGRDKKMLEIFEMIRDLAETDMAVLIQGESGTGKELIAAAIHNEGSRANKLFVPVNCGALPEGLLESELFGHVRGAFTGAIRDKKGRFELADGGTIFLDEIGDISPVMQIKLLRVLQEGSFERVGSEKTMKVNVRVISATNKDLKKELAAGRFREDLFYRLAVVPISIPPLRERRNDIHLLVDHLLKRIRNETGRDKLELSDAALDAILDYDWPGNVRELQNCLQFAMVKCRDKVVRPEHLPPAVRPRQEGVEPEHRKGRLDPATVNTALEQEGGNRVKAAKRLGVSRATLYRFLDKHGAAR